MRTISVISKETTTKFTDRMNTLIHAMIYITGIVSGIFNLTQLIDMMSIGTLLAYIIVAFCILVLRYTNYLLMLFLIIFERNHLYKLFYFIFQIWKRL